MRIGKTTDIEVVRVDSKPDLFGVTDGCNNEYGLIECAGKTFCVTYVVYIRFNTDY